MATPIGHGLAAVSVFWLMAKQLRPRTVPLFVLAVLFALLPDFDFLPGIVFGKPAAYHNGISHSIGFALVAALIGTWFAGRPFRRWTGVVFLVLFSSYASHLLLDFFGTDARPPYGIPVFWPLSSESYLSPTPLFPGVHHVSHTDGKLSEWVDGLLSWHNVQAIAIEMLVLLPFALTLGWRQITKRHQHAGGKATRHVFFRSPSCPDATRDDG